MSSQNADVIVIGSGFGGSVASSRLVDAGKKVVLLERGPWRATVATRSAGIEGCKPLPRDGGMFSLLRSLRVPKGPKKIMLNKSGYLELWIGEGIKAPVTSSVGGGSHVWAALLGRPKVGYWDGRAEAVSDSEMAPHYDAMVNELKAIELPQFGTPAAGAPLFAPMENAEHPPVAILPGDGSGKPVTDENGVTREPYDPSVENGMFGSTGASKSTVDALFLIPAVKRGLDLRPLYEVTEISQSRHGYTITARDHGAGTYVTLTAPRVIVAAGTMNTNALLLTSVGNGKLPAMPALGLGLGANGDLIGKWKRDDTTPLGKVKIAGHEDSAYVLLAPVEAPPLPGFLRKSKVKQAATSIEVVAMSQDASDGRIWNDNGRIRFKFDLKNSPSYAATMRAYDALGAASGCEVKYPDKEVFTAHPCGGCRVSDDPQVGVVDGVGQVHGCPGLYVADASVFPQSLGVPPSLSIAAWASHVAVNLIAEN